MIISELSIVFNYEHNFFIQKLTKNYFDEFIFINEKNKDKEKDIYNINCIKILDDSKIEINDCDFRSILHDDDIIYENENIKIKETLLYIENNNF